MDVSNKIALSITTFDPSATSGILADIKTLESLKVYGVGVTTATTYKAKNNTIGINWQPVSEISAQLIPLLDSYNIVSCKIGSIKNPETLIDILKLIRSYQPAVKIVWDPFFESQVGVEFCTSFNEDSLIEASKMLDLITPNPEELNKLESYSDLAKLSKQVSFLFQKPKKVKSDFIDILQTDTRAIEIGDAIIGSIQNNSSFLSTLITGFLAQGFNIEDSCKEANNFLRNKIQ